MLIVDDEPDVRAGLALAIGGDRGTDVVGRAGDGDEALRLIAELRPDVVLMDIRMPRRDGLSAAVEALERWPQLGIVVLTTFDTDENVLRAIAAGARGFLLKDAAPAALVHAVHTVAAGGSTVAPRVLSRLTALADRSREDAGAVRPMPAALAELTPRERDVAQCVARGCSNAEIAAELFLSVATVKTHLGRIMTKLGVTSRVQVALLLREG